MITSLSPLAVGARILRWSAVVSCVGCARFGYDLPVGSDLGQGGALTLPGGAAGAAGAAVSPRGGASGGGAGSSAADDAGGGVASGSDAAFPGDDEPGPLVPCGSGTFEPPVVLGGLPAPPLFGPSLSANGRTLYFAASGDIFSAQRASIDDTTFADVRPIASVNSALPELTPRLSLDGRVLFFSRDTDGSGFFRDLMQSSRSSTGDDFGSPSTVMALNDPFYSDLSPEPLEDELLFASSRPGGPGLFDIWAARRSNGGGSFDTPVPVQGLCSPEDDSGVAVTADGLTAVLSSARSGSVGNRDLWLATRASRQDEPTVDANLSELNTPENDTDPAWRADGAELLFASDRSGESLLYSALRPCRR